MSEHKCIIGMLNDYENTDLVTLEDLIKTVSENNELLKSYPDIARVMGKVFTMNDYLDRRKTTNLYRFCVCPDCGKLIDWKSLRKEVT